MQNCDTCKHRGTKGCPVRKKALIVGETTQLVNKGFCDRWQPAIGG